MVTISSSANTGSVARREAFTKATEQYKTPTGAIKQQYLKEYSKAYEEMVRKPAEAQTYARMGISKPVIQAPQGVSESTKSYESRTAGSVAKSAAETSQLFSQVTGKTVSVGVTQPFSGGTLFTTSRTNPLTNQTSVNQMRQADLISAEKQARLRNLDIAASDYNLQVQKGTVKSPNLFMSPSEQKGLEKQQEAIKARLDTDINMVRTPTGYMSLLPGWNPYSTQLNPLPGQDVVNTIQGLKMSEGGKLSVPGTIALSEFKFPTGAIASENLIPEQVVEGTPYGYPGQNVKLSYPQLAGMMLTPGVTKAEQVVNNELPKSSTRQVSLTVGSKAETKFNDYVKSLENLGQWEKAALERSKNLDRFFGVKEGYTFQKPESILTPLLPLPVMLITSKAMRENIGQVGANILTIPTKLVFGLSENVLIAGAKTAAMIKGLTIPEIRPAVGGEALKALSETPAALGKAYDPRTPGGLVNIAVTAASIYGLGSARAQTRAQTPQSGSIKSEGFKSQVKGDILNIKETGTFTSKSGKLMSYQLEETLPKTGVGKGTFMRTLTDTSTGKVINTLKGDISQAGVTAQKIAYPGGQPMEGEYVFQYKTELTTPWKTPIKETRTGGVSQLNLKELSKGGYGFKEAVTGFKETGTGLNINTLSSRYRALFDVKISKTGIVNAKGPTVGISLEPPSFLSTIKIPKLSSILTGLGKKGQLAFAQSESLSGAYPFPTSPSGLTYGVSTGGLDFASATPFSSVALFTKTPTVPGLLPFIGSTSRMNVIYGPKETSKSLINVSPEVTPLPKTISDVGPGDIVTPKIDEIPVVKPDVTPDVGGGTSSSGRSTPEPAPLILPPITPLVIGGIVTGLGVPFKFPISLGLTPGEARMRRMNFLRKGASERKIVNLFFEKVKTPLSSSNEFMNKLKRTGMTFQKTSKPAMVITNRKFKYAKSKKVSGGVPVMKGLKKMLRR